MGKHKHKKSKKSKKSSKYEQDSSDEWEESRPLDGETSRSKARSKMRKPMEDDHEDVPRTKTPSAPRSEVYDGFKSGDLPSWRKQDSRDSEHQSFRKTPANTVRIETKSEVNDVQEIERIELNEVSGKSGPAHSRSAACEGPPFVTPSKDEELNAQPGSQSGETGPEWRIRDSTPGNPELKQERKERSPLAAVRKMAEKIEVDLGKQTQEVPSDDKMNQLSAKILKAELRGDQDTAQRLRTQLESATKARLRAEQTAGDTGTTVVIITKDRRDVPDRHKQSSNSSAGRSGRKKLRTEDAWQHLEDKFVRKKVEDDEKMDAVLQRAINKIEAGSSRRSSATNHDRDTDDEEQRGPDAEDQASPRIGVKDQIHSGNSMETCPLCVDSSACVKHLIIHSGENVSLMLPRNGSLTDFHCLLVPRDHLPVLTQADRDTWTEIENLRGILSRVFEAEGMDCVFLQTATVLSRRAHAVMHCVPVNKESAEMMPMYFKKAIEECETEWTMNKKLVRLSVGGVRTCIPKSLPYFAVDFGEQNGYAHVIEDREKFPEYFGLEIIGSVLDVTPSTWLNPRPEPFQDQSKRVIKFENIWTTHECEKKLAS